MKQLCPRNWARQTEAVLGIRTTATLGGMRFETARMQESRRIQGRTSDSLKLPSLLPAVADVRCRRVYGAG